MLSVYQTQFLDAAMAMKALKFGEFTLKSGRTSPYFFNAGAFCDGQSLSTMAQSYAHVIAETLAQGHQIEALFGPAYKGIPLVSAIATALYQQHNINLPWAFNRKEAKDHGEGGIMVGSQVTGKKVLIVDDVLTAGTAVRESLTLLANEQAHPVGLIVALDRQETVGDSSLSALSLIAQEANLFTRAIINLDDLLSYASHHQELAHASTKIQQYREQYGASISVQ
ncbi:orotate phosphoribosyltransferase [Suttonella ornithocola]|uniref:Orotate phosphoribosyltransferase n=1 Tax=Suttonella ornithocola TaxID=279832 RepID=A0A380MT14_9GAMM|nr:orotate phosphoribosyltransferase [Suttonella ornithocola]SUO95759.1 Orotate phosphoribosyltransferase [Suttonella ornithocola]